MIFLATLTLLFSLLGGLYLSRAPEVLVYSQDSGAPPTQARPAQLQRYRRRYRWRGRCTEA